MVTSRARADDEGHHGAVGGDHDQLAALIGILLILVAIPFGLMLAPLALGVVIVWLVLRHVGGAVERPIGEPA